MPETVPPSATFQERTQIILKETTATFINNKLACDRRLGFDNAILTLAAGVRTDEEKPKALGNWHPVLPLDERESAVDTLIFTTDEPVTPEEKIRYFDTANEALWQTAAFDPNPVIAGRALGALVANLAKIETYTRRNDQTRVLAYYLRAMELLDPRKTDPEGFSNKVQYAIALVTSQIEALPKPVVAPISNPPAAWDGYGSPVPQTSENN